MRILTVTATLNSVVGGGGAERTHRLSQALKRLGHDVKVLTLDLLPESSLLSTSFIDEAYVTALACLNRRFMIPFFSVPKLRKLIRESDIVHLNGHWSFLNGLIYIFTRMEKKPYIVSPIGTLPIFGRSKIIKNIYNYLVGYSIIRNADGHVAVTLDEKLQFMAYGVDLNKVSVISNGVDLDAFLDIDPLNFRLKNNLGSSPIILFMGRLNSIKGPDLLLAAFEQVAQKFPLFFLVFVGPDEGMKKQLKREAQKLGIERRVRFLGYLDGDEKVAAYRAASLLVIPSRLEAMSIVALEAGAAKIPVLITNKCGFDEVGKSDGGVVVEASASAIAEGLSILLSDPDALSKKGINLYNLIKGKYTWDAAGSNLESLFAKILSH
jgi:glycosyltransferase involved in cell wall biosynthesis